MEMSGKLQGKTTDSVKRDGYASRGSTLERAVRRYLPRPELLDQRLSRTGKKIRVDQYIALNLMLIAVVSMVLVAIVGLPPLLSVAIGIASGIGLPHIAVNRMVNKRLERFTALFPDAIDLIVRGLRSGLPVTESISSVGQEMAEPVGGEFRRIAESVKLGRTLEDAMWDTAKRLATADFKFFVISLSVQRETGGNLAETLGNLSDILRRRRQMRLKIKAMSSEARASAYILGSLPFIMFAIIYFLNPGYEMELFTDPRGRIMLAFGLTTISVGILVMSKMVRFEI
jgi:tight adherence protein B